MVRKRSGRSGSRWRITPEPVIGPRFARTRWAPIRPTRWAALQALLADATLCRQVRRQRPGERASGTIEETMKLTANLFAALAVLLSAQTVSAQSPYPNRPVKILVVFTPGTAPDLAARILAGRFSAIRSTPFVVGK